MTSSDSVMAQVSLSAIDDASNASVEYLDRIRELLPAIAGRAEEAEALGSVPHETIVELQAAKVLSALQPKQWGGLELDPTSYFQGIGLLGSVCASTAWVASVLGLHPWEVACLHRDAQAEVWGDDPDARISSSYAPTGNATRVSDGYMLSGQWRFSSGVDHCEWALLGAFVEGEESQGPRVFLIDRTNFEVDESSWNVAGLSGTGSKNINVDGAVVPDYRTHTMAEILSPDWDRPGWATNQGPLYRLEFSDLFAWGIAGPALGAAAGFVNEWLRQTRDRLPGFGGPGVADQPEVKLRLAKGLSSLDGLERSMASIWDELYGAVADGGLPERSTQMQARYQGAATVADSLEVAMTLFATAGGGVMDRSNPLQRFLRDLLAMRNHPIASLERYAGDQAKLALELA